MATPAKERVKMMPGLPLTTNRWRRRCSAACSVSPTSFCVLSKGSLRREFTQLEVREAQRLGKKVVLVDLQAEDGGTDSVGSYLDDAKAGGYALIDGRTGHTADLFNHAVSKPL